MDSSARFLDSARDPYALRQPPPVGLSGGLTSGQSYYTVESLEGASSLPPLKSSFGPSAPLPFDRDALLGLDARTRALLADRDAVDPRARLLAAEREALLRRNVPGAPSTERRAFDGLAPVDTRSRYDGVLPLDARARNSLDELQNVDLRARALGLDLRPQDAFRPGIDDRTRALDPLAGLTRRAPEQISETARGRELAGLGRSSVPPFLPPANYRGRDIADIRAPVLPPNPSLSRWETANRSAATFPRTDRSARTTKQAPVASRSAPSQAVRKELKDVANVKTPPAKPKTIPAPEESKGWCAVCKINCVNVKTLEQHVTGKKHKALLEGKQVNPKEPFDGGKPTPAATSQSEKKRASDTKPEALHGAKRSKTSEPGLGNGTAVEAAHASKGTANESSKEKTKEKAKVPATKDAKEVLTCELCNIFTTGQFNLDAHLKGRRHAARLKELANRELAK